MSVKVSILIGDHVASRHLIITRVTNTTIVKNVPHTLLSTYQVELRQQGEYRSATFEHYFGDDVTILIAKAGEALRAKYGNV